MRHAGLLLLLLGLAFLPATGAPSTEGRPARSDVERLVRRYYEQVASESDSAKAEKVVDETLSHEFLFSFGNGKQVAKGIDLHKRWLAWHHRVGAAQAWTIEDLVIENGLAAARFRLQLTHQDTFLGIPATGKTITVRGMDLLRVADGRIAELYRVFDGRDVVLQMGATCPGAVPASREP